MWTHHDWTIEWLFRYVLSPLKFLLFEPTFTCIVPRTLPSRYYSGPVIQQPRPATNACAWFHIGTENQYINRGVQYTLSETPPASSTSSGMRPRLALSARRGAAPMQCGRNCIMQASVHGCVIHITSSSPRAPTSSLLAKFSPLPVCWRTRGVNVMVLFQVLHVMSSRCPTVAFLPFVHSFRIHTLAKRHHFFIHDSVNDTLFCPAAAVALKHRPVFTFILGL
jgi:hypothetical protein